MATKEDHKTLFCRSVVIYTNAESNFQSRMEISKIVEVPTSIHETDLLDFLKRMLRSRILKTESYVKSIDDIDIININTLW